MEHRRVGRTALQVSSVALGTMNFGPVTPEPVAHQMLSAAIDAGITMVDTADQYGGDHGVGATEAIIGRWLAADPSRRDRIVLATKVHEPMGEGPNDRGLSAHHIVRACDASLRRLGTDRIDIYQMHHVDRAAPWDEVWQAMETLVAQGKVIYVASSNFAGWHIGAACEAAARRSTMGLISEQSLYHLAERRIELEVLPACAHYGLGLFPWSPLGGGLLAGAAANAADGSRRQSPHMQAAVEAHRPALEAWEQLCAAAGLEPAVAALAWLMHQPGVTAPVVGPRTPDQLDDAIAAAAVVLDDAFLDAVDGIFPGPGPAPEAYAW